MNHSSRCEGQDMTTTGEEIILSNNRLFVCRRVRVRTSGHATGDRATFAAAPPGLAAQINNVSFDCCERNVSTSSVHGQDSVLRSEPRLLLEGSGKCRRLRTQQRGEFNLETKNRKTRYVFHSSNISKTIIFLISQFAWYPDITVVLIIPVVLRMSSNKNERF